MGSQKSLFLSHPCQLNHGVPSHPENSARLDAILTALKESSYKSLVNLSIPRQATRDELSKVHDITYIDRILALDGKNAALDYETTLTPGSVKAALSASGLGVELVEQVLNNKIQNGFVIVRPPGHHARPSHGMGFCLFNNIAVAAQKALTMGLKRILILDWDVHHGNGTQESFYDDDRVLFVDLHQDNLFPVPSGELNEIGRGKGIGYTVNIPLPAACGDAEYLHAFDNLVKPLALKFKPELILVSAGFDAHESDPLGFMNLTTEGFGKLTARIKALAETLCEGKLILFLEGGYNPFFLAKNVLECIKVLVDGAEPDLKPENASKQVQNLVRDIHDLHVKNTAK